VPLFPVDYADRKPLGRSGESVSAIGLGTWGIRDEARAFEALVYGVELGLDLIDTAEMYGGGRAEELVGRVIREVGRDRVFVVTKLYPHRFREPGRAVEAAEACLRRLGVSYVDLLLIHWPDDLAPVWRQVRSLEAVAERGLTRYVGVSNFNLEQLSEAIQSTRRYEIVVDQVKYSVVDRSIERDLLGFCARAGVTVMAYTPLERGAVARVGRVREVASRYGRTPIQVALNYLISRPRVVAVPKSERREHVEEIRGALGWRLEEGDIELLERL
jgi:diketogulonate reductase-like aldo/keto reductase